MSINPTTPAEPQRPLHHRLLAIVAPLLAHAHHRRYHGRPHHLVIDTFLNVAMWGLVAWIIVLAVVKVATTTPQVMWDVSTVTSGQAVTATLTVTAPSTGRIGDVQADVIVPTGWLVDEATAQSLGAMERRAVRTITFHLVPVAAPSAAVNLVTHLAWTVAGASLETEHVQHISVQGTSGALTLTAPASVRSGQMIPLTLTAPTSLADLRLMKVVSVTLPKHVTRVSTEPSIDGTTWTIESNTVEAKTLIMRVTTSLPAGTRLRFSATLAWGVGEARLVQVTRTTDVLITATSGEEVVNGPSTTAVTFAAELRYTGASGVQFGYGPLPPIVGQETVYRAFLYVRPGSADGHGATVTMSLPAGTRWIGHSSLTGGSRVVWNSSARTITWQIGELAANVAPLMASFDLGLTPKTTQRGSVVTMTGPAKLTYQSDRDGLQSSTAAALTTASVDGGKPSLATIR